MPRNRAHAYDTLLRVRERQEDLRMQALAEARRAVNVAQRRRDELHQEQMRVLDETGARLRAEFDAVDIRRYYQHERYIARLGDETDALIRQLEGEAEKRRAELEEAAKRRKIVEKLQEHARLATRKAQLKDEQHQMDEVATTYAALGLLPGGWSEHKERQR